MLKKRGEEEEELHPGQALTQTHPATCNQEEPRQSKRDPEAQRRDVDLPAEKGRKASLLTNRPSLSRKWAGLKVCGFSHWLSSYKTEVSRGMTIVPCGQIEPMKNNVAT